MSTDEAATSADLVSPVSASTVIALPVASIAAGPARPSTLADFRAAFRDGKAALLGHFRRARPSAREATRLVRDLARHVDATLISLWNRSDMPPGSSLLAVGGYGRGELFPYSDVDVLVLLPDIKDVPDPMDPVERFITTCWDIGLEIGSSVRTVGECIEMAKSDVTVQTALLESRCLAGSKTLCVRFFRESAAVMDPLAFFRAKSREMTQRHQKYENTPYSLEPNCKESPGGLRDLQTVIWVARAAGLGSTWKALAAKGLATPFEVQQLQRNEGLLRLVRARLHLIAGRREDRLVFDLQAAVAESFGFSSSATHRASEVLMRRYYWAAKAVTQLNLILMLNIEERIAGLQDAPMSRIDDEFLERGGMIEVASDDVYQRNPHAILKTFLAYQQNIGPKGLSARTLRALYNARHLMDAEFRRDPVNHATFMAILQAAGGQTHAFRLMNETSVLGRYLWVFRRIVGQMQHDLFHVYTVDQHILMVLRNVRRFFIPEHAHEYPFCSQLASTFDRPWVLYIAALFHDVAKGRGGDHSELGELEVRRFCADHGVEGEDEALIEFLVGEHLSMSRIAQKEDLSDPDVIAGFSALVGTERRLTALYLLTVADIRGTSPKVWNGWKGKLLEDLYRLALRALGGARPNLDAEIESTKLEARLLLRLAALPGTAETPLWHTLELSYFARHEAGEIAWHTRSLLDLVDTTEPVVRARVSPFGEGLQVLVYAPDRQDLFARTCGYFDGASFNILDAKVHTTTIGYALDTFLVVNAHVDQYRDLIRFVETQLSAALAATGPLPEPSRGRISRRVKSFPITPRITLRPDDRAQRWLLGVSASDRSGLLYAISRVLAEHSINLQLAKITTLGERVEDTFLIDGPALQQNKLQLQIETEMLAAIA